MDNESINNSASSTPASSIVQQESSNDNIETTNFSVNGRDNDPTRFSRFITAIILIVVLIGSIVGVIAITSPSTFSAIANAFWMVLFCLVSTFLLLGVLIMIGLKDQVKQILDIFVEGSLTIVDLLDFLKSAWQFVLDVFKQVIYFLVPVIAYGIGAVIYYVLLLAYKWIGRDYDVTLFTIFLAALLTFTVGFLNKPIRKPTEGTEPTWGKKIQMRFKDIFSDAIEVVLFVFFMTMDSQKLFFLPADLGKVELQASYGTYDFMVRGWHVDHYLRTTLSLVMIAVGIEILRYAIRILAAGMGFYKEVNMYIGESNNQMNGSSQIKWAIRQGFEVHKDDSVRFIVYTTFIIFVFLMFPRLKLLAMAVASISALILDLSMRSRLVIKKNHDLFSKLVSAVFRV